MINPSITNNDIMIYIILGCLLSFLIYKFFQLFEYLNKRGVENENRI
jgi:hypothetical protein